MIKHVVMQKFPNPADALETASKLRALMGVVPSLRSMEVGINELPSDRAFDVVLIATFDDINGLHAYDSHPAHEAVRAFIRPRRSGTASVDFTLE